MNHHFESTVSEMRAPDSFFTAGGPVWIARAPGRLDLMGGNVDYTGGLVFETTIREATWAAVQRRPDDRILFLNPQMRERGWRECVEFSLAQLVDEESVRCLVNQDSATRWTAYVLGVFYFLRQRYAGSLTSGASVYIESEVPLNKGVSSSAAVEVAVMKAAAGAYNIELQGIELAEACQWVENVIAESACGIMDQATVVLGDESCMLPLLCQPCRPYPLVKLPEELRVWAIDSGVSHAVTGIEYEAARAAAFMGYKLICDWEGLPLLHDNRGRIPRWTDLRWNGYISNIPPSVFRSRYESRLPEMISGESYLRMAGTHVDPFTGVRSEVPYRVRACTRYAVEENQRIQLFVELARGASQHPSEDAFVLMGDLMYQSHWSYTECGLGCEATDQIVELVRSQGSGLGLYGAKVTGGGAGGTVVILGRRDAGGAFRQVVDRYAEIRGGSPYVFEGSSEGADRFGTQMLAN